MSPLSDWKEADTPYLQYIQNTHHRHPTLKLLRTLPLRPSHPTRVKILEFTQNSTINELEFHKLPQLEAYLSSPPPPCKGRLYLIEDISLPWLSSLGSHFTIDPHFFAEYLKLDLDRTQHLLEGYHTMRRLASQRRASTFATFVYHEIRTFDGRAPRREEYEILTRDNVGRLVTTVDHHCGRATGLIRRNMGCWWREGGGLDGDGDGWDAIILVDPGASDEFQLRRWTSDEKCAPSPWSTTTCHHTPYLDGYLDFTAWPPPPSQKQDHTTYPSNILEAIAHHWIHTPLPSFPTTPLTAFLPAHLILASHWNLQLEYLISVVSDLEKGLLRFEQMDAHPRAETIVNEVRALRTLLGDVNSWRRRVYFYEEQMRWNVEGVVGMTGGTEMVGVEMMGRDLGLGLGFGGFTRGGHGGDGGGGEGEDVFTAPAPAPADDHHRHPSNTNNNNTPLTDLTPLLPPLHLTSHRIHSLLPVALSALSLLEAQHSVLKADLTIRLSTVALIFVPLSFTASLLSMSDDFLPGKGLFWVYWVVSVPLIGGLFWWAYWVQVGRVRRRVDLRRLFGRGKGDG